MNIRLLMIHLIVFITGLNHPMQSAQSELDEQLLQAAVKDNNQQLEALLVQGANPNALAEGRLYKLTSSYYPQYFVPRKTSANSALHLAALRGNNDGIKLLLRYKADINAKNITEATPLIVAILSKKIDTTALLIECGADVNVKRTVHGDTPLMNAVIFLTQPMIQMLVEAGADILIKNSKGENAINLAKDNGKIDNAAYLESALSLKKLN